VSIFFRHRMVSHMRRRSDGRATAPKPSLFVRNVSTRLDTDGLYDAFTKFGKIKDIYLPRDYYTGTPRGFGFVEFFDFRDAEDAQHEMDGRLLDGKALEITFAQSDRRSSSEMRAKDQPPRRDRSPGRRRDFEEDWRDRQGGKRRPPHRSRSRSRSRERSQPKKRPRRRSRDSRDRTRSQDGDRRRSSPPRSPRRHSRPRHRSSSVRRKSRRRSSDRSPKKEVPHIADDHIAGAPERSRRNGPVSNPSMSEALVPLERSRPRSPSRSSIESLESFPFLSPAR